MRTPYQMLNDNTQDAESYAELPLNEVETQKIKQTLHQATPKQKSGSHRRQIAAVACCALCLGLLSQTAIADQLLSRITKSIDLGHIQAYQSTTDATPPSFYDQEGNLITDTENFQGSYYDEKGFFLGKTTDHKSLPELNEGEVSITDTALLAEKLCFTAKTPTYLPEGFAYSYATYYETSSQYATFYFLNEAKGTWFCLMERELTPETSYAISTDGDLQEVTINGTSAILMDRSLDWEIDGVAYSLCGRNTISTEALVKVAESIV